MSLSNNGREFLAKQIASADKQIVNFSKQLDIIKSRGHNSDTLSKTLALHQAYKQKLQAQHDLIPDAARAALTPEQTSLFVALVKKYNADVTAKNITPTPDMFCKLKAAQEVKLSDDMTVVSAQFDPAILDARDETGRTLLIYAAANGLTQASQALMDAGANADLFDLAGHNALYYAAKGFHTESTALLATRCDVNHKYIDTGDTAASVLVLHLNQTHTLVVAGLDPVNPIAIYKGNASNIIISQASNISSIESRFKAEDGYSTAQEMALNVINKMKEAGADLTSQNLNGDTMFDHISTNGITPTSTTVFGLRFLAKSLIKMHSPTVDFDISKIPLGKNPVAIAFETNNLLLMEALIKLGVSTDITDSHGATMLLRAMANANTPMADMLLSDINSESVNLHNAGFISPFVFACDKKNIELAMKIAQHPKFDPYQMGPDNKNMMKWAMQSGSLELMTLLSQQDESGVLFEQRDDFDQTCLHTAATNRAYAHMFEFLLKHSDPNAKFTKHIEATLDGEKLFIPLTDNINGEQHILERNAFTACLETGQFNEAFRILHSDKFTDQAYIDPQMFNILHWLSQAHESRSIHDLAIKHPYFVNAKDDSYKTPLAWCVEYWYGATASGNLPIAEAFAKVIVELVAHGSTVEAAWIQQFPLLGDNVNPANIAIAHAGLVHDYEAAGEVQIHHDMV